MSYRSLSLSVFYVFVGAIAACILYFANHIPHGVQHWSADFVTATLSKRVREPYPNIRIVEVSEGSLRPYPYESPTNRKLLADLIRAVASARPRAIGVDIVFDRPTEEHNDEELKEVIRDSPVPIALGSVDDASIPLVKDREFQRDFIKFTGRPEGHLYFDESHQNPIVLSDDVIRSIARNDSVNPPRQSFVEAILEAARIPSAQVQGYISWLLPRAKNDEVFQTFEASHVLGRAEGLDPLPLEAIFADKLVLIGTNVAGRDKHTTPLSLVDGERVSGAFIHAQILAQYLDRRSLLALGPLFQITLACVAFVSGVWLGRRDDAHRYQLIIELLSVPLLVGVGIALFVLADVIFPFVPALVGLLMGVAGGHVSHMLAAASPTQRSEGAPA